MTFETSPSTNILRRVGCRQFADQRGRMDEFLMRIIDAHGGLDRWNAFQKVNATLVTGGAFWGMKGLVQDPAPRQMTVLLHEQYASVTPFGATDQRTSFSPDRIAIEKTDGSVVAERFTPRDLFAEHQLSTPWDPLHRAYFNGYALWTYLTTPFLLLMTGVLVEEIEPWREGSEQWRRIRAQFPRSIATHSVVQDFFFDQNYLLQRHDYHVDIAGGFAAAQRVYDYVETDGIRLPSKRRAYRRGADDQVLEDVLMVSIDISEIRFC